MTSCKYAKDVDDGDQIMMGSCPVLVQRVLGPAHMGRNEYFFTGNDIIDGREYGQSFQPNDTITMADVKYKEKRVVCAPIGSMGSTVLNSFVIERGICGNLGDNICGRDPSHGSKSSSCTGYLVYAIISQDVKDNK